MLTFPETFVLIAPRRGFHIGTLLAVSSQVCYAQYGRILIGRVRIEKYGRLAGDKWLNLLYKRMYGTIEE